MAGRGPRWAAWVDRLPGLASDQLRQWHLTLDGEATQGNCSLVLPVLTPDRGPAVLKIGFPDNESEHEHLSLRRWAGGGAVRLLSADPHRRALLLERLHARDLSSLWDIEACEVVAGLYRRIHVPALPQLRTLAHYVERWTADLETLPRSAPIPRRLVEQAISLGRQFAGEATTSATVIHRDLHYGNVLAGDREPWLVIDPKPVNGDPHYEVAPMLWNRWDELSGYVRDGVRRRFFAIVDAADFDEDRARSWVVVRMVHNAMWELQQSGNHVDSDWLTTCVAICKAV